VTQRRFDHRFGRGRAVLFEQIFFQRAAVHADANRNLLRLRGAHNFDDAFMLTDIAGIQTQLVDAGFQCEQCELVVKVYVGNERNFRHALANFFQRQCRVVVRHSQTHNFAAGVDHLLDLFDGLIDVGRIGLGHRLNDHRRAATDLHVFDLNWSGLPHFQLSTFRAPTCRRWRDKSRL
jgi:hypothetical protein